MNRLFLRIFFGFWLTTLLALLLGQQATQYLARSFDERQAIHQQHEQARHFARRVHRIVNTLPEEAWTSRLQAIDTEFPWRLHLPWREDIERGLALPDNAANLLQRPRQPPQRVKGGIVMLRALRPPGHPRPAVLMIKLKRPHPLWIELFHRHLWLRLLLAITATALLCYWMVRRYTQPVHALREATRTLAEGDLTVRLPETEARDDLAALHRDFNAMAAKLQDAYNRQQTLVHDVSHELRTPLARIQAALALARRRRGDSEELKRIAEECDNLNRLIDQLLQNPEGELALSDTVVLDELLDNLQQANQLEAESHRVTIVVENKATPIWLQAASDPLRTALENILRNAIRHAPLESTVNVQIQRDTGGDVQVTISDQGEGVAESELDKLFLPFYRADKARQLGRGGYGLGLSIAARIIQQHGGKIHARNTHPGFAMQCILPKHLIVEPPEA